ncbi:MAG: hypothetical protein O3C46_07060, partial [Bacteroidetes bacterium]|nr:hypothetical protein [Bacteroidota bacterium]
TPKLQLHSLCALCADLEPSVVKNQARTKKYHPMFKPRYKIIKIRWRIQEITTFCPRIAP